MTIYEIEPVFDNPLYDCLDTDHQAIFEFQPKESQSNPTTWKPVLKKEKWVIPQVTGNVRAFNDYPCIDLSIPAFSKRAVDLLGDILLANGELLPVKHKIGTYYVYNCTNMPDCLDLERIETVESGGTILRINKYYFIESQIQDLVIFKLRVKPLRLYCTQIFVDRVHSSKLEGFQFIQIWPLPEGSTLFDEIKRVRNAGEKLRPKDGPPIEVKGNTVVVRLYLERKKPKKEETKLADEILDSIEKMLYDPNQSSAESYFGSVEQSETVDYEIRIFISSPDCNRLVEKLRPYLEKLPWQGKFHVVKRFGEYVDQDVREEYVLL